MFETIQTTERRIGRDDLSNAARSIAERDRHASQSSVHFSLNWAKERVDEMDVTLAFLESKTTAMQDDAGLKADQFIAALKEKRDEFERAVKKQSEAGEATWDSAEVRLETEWKGFETEIKKYLETFGKGIEQQQAVFQSQVTAQLDAWRDTADKLMQPQRNSLSNAAGKSTRPYRA